MGFKIRIETENVKNTAKIYQIVQHGLEFEQFPF